MILFLKNEVGTCDIWISDGLGTWNPGFGSVVEKWESLVPEKHYNPFNIIKYEKNNLRNMK